MTFAYPSTVRNVRAESPAILRNEKCLDCFGVGWLELCCLVALVIKWKRTGEKPVARADLDTFFEGLEGRVEGGRQLRTLQSRGLVSLVGKAQGTNRTLYVPLNRGVRLVAPYILSLEQLVDLLKERLDEVRDCA